MESNIPYVIPLNAQKPKVLTLVPSDPGSRYKTKQLQVQTVGKSKMIKSVFTNILEVAKSMQVPPSYVIHFMGYEIGAQAKFDSKKPERAQAFLSGEHDPKELSRIMLQFITEVILCGNCGLPELLITVENKNPTGGCRACGANLALPITNEKFKRHILNHPPTAGSGAFAGNKAGKKKDTSARKEKESSSSSKSSKSSSKSSKKEKPAKEEDEDNSDEDVANGDDSGDEGGDVVWFSDTSAEAARKRREELLPDANLFKTDNDAPKHTVDDYKKLIADVSEGTFDDLRKLKNGDGIDDVTFMSLVFEALFPSGSDTVAIVKKNVELLKKLVTISKSGQTLFLDAVEKVFGADKTLVTKCSFAIKELYDQDLIEEEQILAWFDQGSTSKTADKAVRANLGPLIKWFKEAEEESSGEEEDEEEEEEDIDEDEFNAL